MRREGRPHGSVRTHEISTENHNSRIVENQLKSPATAGVFTRVPSRPTNHSKFTGRCCKAMCGVCHLQPAGKAKGKLEGLKMFGTGSADLDDRNVYGFVDDDDEDEIREVVEEEEKEYHDAVGLRIIYEDDDEIGSSGSSDDSEGWVVLENINDEVLSLSD